MAQPSTNPKIDDSYIFEAQKSAMESSAKLNSLAFNYAMEINKTLFEIGQNTFKDYTHLQQRLFQWPSPEDFITSQAEMMEKTAKGFKDGFDRIADVSSEIAHGATQAVQGAKESIRDAVNRIAGSEQQGQARH